MGSTRPSHHVEVIKLREGMYDTYGKMFFGDRHADVGDGRLSDE
jgi:hypothetical protein